MTIMLLMKKRGCGSCPLLRKDSRPLEGREVTEGITTMTIKPTRVLSEVEAKRLEKARQLVKQIREMKIAYRLGLYTHGFTRNVKAKIKCKGGVK
jgi:hypothetical protein